MGIEINSYVEEENALYRRLLNPLGIEFIKKIIYARIRWQRHSSLQPGFLFPSLYFALLLPLLYNAVAYDVPLLKYRVGEV